MGKLIQARRIRRVAFELHMFSVTGTLPYPQCAVTELIGKHIDDIRTRGLTARSIHHLRTQGQGA